MKNIPQRDAFWGRIYELAKADRNIVAVIADMGAPALDRFRLDLPSQYLDVGIAEQQGLGLSTGLALTGKKPFLYAIAPFVALRCYEQTRVNMASMNVPVTLVGVGAGVSYDDSGPTHHAVDDLSVLRILPKLVILNASDCVMARAFADITTTLKRPTYVRLDRQSLPVLYAEGTDFSSGLHVHAKGKGICIVATGNMVHRALEARKALAAKGKDVGVIDVYQLPINEASFLNAVSKYQTLVTLEEHNLKGGLGSAVCEVLADHVQPKRVKRLGMDFTDGYCYKYGGRDNIQKLYGLDLASVVKTVASL